MATAACLILAAGMAAGYMCVLAVSVKLDVHPVLVAWSAHRGCDALPLPPSLDPPTHTRVDRRGPVGRKERGKGGAKRMEDPWENAPWGIPRTLGRILTSTAAMDVEKQASKRT
eukprot:scaffold840_cov344-Pavlova_lutheri.AAC.121